MKKFIILFVAGILITVVVGIEIYIWRSLTFIRRQITGDLDGHLLRQLCKPSQRMFVGYLLGFFAALVILILCFPSIKWKYQIVLAMSVGMFLTLLIFIANSGPKNKK